MLYRSRACSNDQRTCSDPGGGVYELSDNGGGYGADRCVYMPVEKNVKTGTVYNLDWSYSILVGIKWNNNCVELHML